MNAISDKDLLANTENLVKKERELLSEVLRHLREIQRRRLYSDLGFPSLFEYCVKSLKYSEAQTHRRIVAMRMIVEIPEIEEKIESGDLSLSNLVRAKTFFNQEEKSAPMARAEMLEVLTTLENKSAREGEKILLAISGEKISVKESQRQVTAEITELRFGADEKLLAKINHLKGLLAHKKSGASLAEIFSEICDVALEKLDPASKQLASRSKSNPLLSTSKVTRYIPAKTKSEIWKKSNGVCSKCSSRYALEIDHVKPYSLGGTNDCKNLRLLCRSCNQRQAIKSYGLKKMANYLN